MSKKLSKVIRLVIIALSASLLLSACSPKPGSEPEDTYPVENASLANTLVIAEIEDPVTFDPMYANDTTVNRACVLVYDSLVRYDPVTKAVVPSLAKEWTISDDAMQITMKLNEGVKFHDGSELTSADVKYSFERILELKQGIYFDLASLDRVDVVDEYTFTLVLNEPRAVFVESLSKMYILNEDGLKANEVDGDSGTRYLSDHDLGSGPYVLTEFVPEQQAVFDRFDDYWQGWEDGQVESVIYTYVKEPATQRLLLEKGDVDIILEPSANDLPDLLNNSDIKVDISDTFMETYVHFRTNHPPLDDVRVRKALAMAYDYANHIKVALGGYGVQAQGPLPRAFRYHNNDIEMVKFDIEGVKQLLAEAGYPDGGFTLSLAYEPVIEEKARIVELMHQNYQLLGITIEPMPMTWDAMFSMETDENSEPDMYTESFFAFSSDPEGVLRDIYHGDSRGVGSNASWYQNDEVDRLLDEVRVERDPAVREELYMQIQQLIADDYPSIFVSNPSDVVAMRTWVEGYVYNPVHLDTVNAYEITLVDKPDKP